MFLENFKNYFPILTQVNGERHFFTLFRESAPINRLKLF
jgi:hypothetical protein